jgi:hypothetical protein
MRWGREERLGLRGGRRRTGIGMGRRRKGRCDGREVRWAASEGRGRRMDRDDAQGETEDVTKRLEMLKKLGRRPDGSKAPREETES